MAIASCAARVVIIQIGMRQQAKLQLASQRQLPLQAGLLPRNLLVQTCIFDGNRKLCRQSRHYPDRNEAAGKTATREPAPAPVPSGSPAAQSARTNVHFRWQSQAVPPESSLSAYDLR